MNIGRIEPYNGGFLEVLPEVEESDYWQIAAIHINGQAFFPTPRLYRSEKVALAQAAQIYDWIVDGFTTVLRCISRYGINPKRLNSL